MSIDIQKAGGLFLLFLSCAVSAAGGIGGGGLTMPILLVVMGFGYDDAVALSLCSVFGNSGCQFLINRNRAHPNNPRRPMIYWEAVLIMMPSQLGGSILGVVSSSAIRPVCLTVSP